MPELEIKSVPHDSPEYWLTVELRDEVLRQPLGLEFSDRELREESGSFHLAGIISGQVICCLVLRPVDDKCVQMRQLAVSEECQRQGHGRSLVKYAEKFAKNKGFTQMMLHARDVATGFYDKLGYKKIGEQFIEVGLVHWEMILDL